MMHSLKPRVRASVVVLLAVGACTMDPAGSQPETQIASVVPAANAENVDPGSAIRIRFSHGMMQGMESYMALHEGSVSGPVVAGMWMWSADRTEATFRPAAALTTRTAYVIHVGGGLWDAEGRMLGLGEHCLQLGGQWAQRSMMGSGGAMMGSGWSHVNGTYGMVFRFVVA